MRLSQSDQDLSLTGTRPPSACSSSRPGSRSGRSYVKVANTSTADELLFSSSASQLNLQEASFDAPWAKKDKRQVLLWSPAPGSRRSPPPGSRPHTNRPSSIRSEKTTNKNTPKIKDSMLKNKHVTYKLVKNRPSFVDECLFGTRLEEPSFVAPWNVKHREPGAKTPVRPFHWDYTDYRPVSQADRGRSMNLDLRHKSPAGQCLSARTHSQTRPVWKP